MRINLVDPDKRKRKRRKGRKKTHAYDTAISQPQIQPRRVRAHRPSRVQEEPARPKLEISWRRLVSKLPIFLVLAGLIGVIGYTSMSEEFFVYSAEIGGTQHLDAQEIYEAAGVHEQNIFWIRPDDVADRISQIHGIKSVRVQVRLPARVIIEVEERQPAMVWRVKVQSKDWWLDEEGVVLPYGGDAHAPGVIFVVDESDRFLEEGDRVDPEDIVVSVKQLAEALPQAEFFAYEGERGLSFDLRTQRGHWPVYVGTSDDLTRKIQVVQALDAYLAQRNIVPHHFDVRRADHPVYGKPAGSASGGNQ